MRFLILTGKSGILTGKPGFLHGNPVPGQKTRHPYRETRDSDIWGVDQTQLKYDEE